MVECEGAPITRVVKCPFCRKPFSRQAWVLNHTQICRKWLDVIPRPELCVDGETVALAYPQHIHSIPGGWTYITPEPDRQAAIAEFVAAEKPKRPGVVEHPSIHSYEINKLGEIMMTEHGSFKVRSNGKEWVVEYDDGKPTERFGSVPGMLYRLQQLLDTEPAATAVQIGIDEGSQS